MIKIHKRAFSLSIPRTYVIANLLNNKHFPFKLVFESEKQEINFVSSAAFQPGTH